MTAGLSYGDVLKELQRVGLGEHRAFAMAGFKDAKDILTSLYPEVLYFEEEIMGRVQEWLDGAEARSSLAIQANRINVSGSLEDALWSAVNDKAQQKEDEEDPLLVAASSRTSRPSSRALPVWRPSSKRRKTEGGLVAADRATMDRWATRLADIMRDGETPSWNAAFDTVSPIQAIAGMVGKARPSTVKKRVLTWERFSRWLQMRSGRIWPRCSNDLLDYLNEKVAEENCSRSFATELRASVSWIEARTGFGDDLKYGHDELFIKNIERATVVLGSEAVAVLKAPRLPLIVLASLELYVMDVAKPVGLRVVAWSRLIKVYSVLRWDDLQRLRPRDLAHRASGLVGRLTQTKTTGVGKKVRDLPLVVPKEAFIVEPQWIETGYTLWEAIGDLERDYFIPRISADMKEFTGRPASSRDLATLGTIVLAELTTPVRVKNLEGKVSGPKDSGGSLPWMCGKVRLIPVSLATGWTGHSERSTLPSLLAAMGVAKADRDPLGRWSPSGSDEYVRTYKVLVRSLALRIRAMIKEGKAFDVADEEEAVDEVLTFLIAKGKEISEETRIEAAEFLKVAKAFYSELAEAAPVLEAPLPAVSEAGSLPLEEAEEVAPFIIACSKRGASRCLHKGGGCWRARGYAFLSYELVYDSPVPAPLYNTHCRDCWPKDGLPSQAVAAGVSSESSAGSSESS
jgi:hypothetical protein